MTAPSWSRRRRLLVFTAIALFVSGSLYVVIDVLTSPFSGATLLGGNHPELIIGRSWHPRSGTTLVLRDDLPSQCNCPLHQMLRGNEVVTIGWSRFVANHDDSLQQGHLTGNKYDGKDLAPNRMIILRRKDATSLEVDLIQFWDPLATWRQLQDRLGGVMRSLIH